MICTERVISADLRIEFSKLQEKVNFSISPQGVSLIRPNSETPRSYLHEGRSTEPRTTLREVKARGEKIVRKGIYRLEMQIKQYIKGSGRYSTDKKV